MNIRFVTGIGDAVQARMKGRLATHAHRIRRERYGLAFGLFAAVIWGGYLAVTRQGIDAGLTAADLAFLRYATAGLLLLPWFISHQPLRLAGIGWPKGILLAVLAEPPFVLVGASGFAFAPLAHAAVIQLGALPLIRANGEEDALRIANDTEFGLSSAVVTRDVERGTRFAHRLEAGMTHVNDMPAVDLANMPFGGEKNSGLGRFGARGVIEDFTTEHWISVQHTPRQYPF